MALRTFHANPSLGGFGGESSSSSAPRQVASSLAPQDDCDAFAQIVKELVDNAVDACQQDSLKHNNNNKRIRVVIEQMNHHAEEHYPVLRVTVSDNGVGMSNVESSVNAFRTSKANNEHSSAGRYGIGLTLCLLHAQRLVPNSCASITSATKESSRYIRASFVVDTMGDSVKCVKQEQLPKNSPEESGTAVSLLVPVCNVYHCG
jgi:DNA topoisomerase VI subunit B